MTVLKNYHDNSHLIIIDKDEIEKIDFAKCKEPRETLKNFYDRQTIKPDIITNAGFFNMSTGDTVFNYMDDKEIKSNYSLHRWGMGLLPDNTLKYGCLDYEDWTDFISGFPNLIDNREKVDISYANEINYKARRTILGYNSENVYILLVENPGKTLNECQDIMLDAGCDYAINLDGGGSTKCLDANGDSITRDLTNRPVDNVLCIYLKKEELKQEQKVLYRVQLGAYGREAGAKEYLKVIRKLKSNIGINYGKAYIRRVNDLYKVQVGAFSKKQNAINVRAELESLGFHSFITTN